LQGWKFVGTPTVLVGGAERFNGAILLQGWKYGLLAHPRRRSCGFNGAILLQGWK